MAEYTCVNPAGNAQWSVVNKPPDRPPGDDVPPGDGGPPNEAASLDEATDAVLLASRALVGVAAGSLASVEEVVTLHQYRALVLIGTSGERNVGGLADGLGIHPSTATRMCDRLLAKGLIERTPSEDSRREVMLRLSPEGRQTVSTVMVQRRRELRRILGRLTPGERGAVVAALTAFASAAGESADAAWMLGWPT